MKSLAHRGGENLVNPWNKDPSGGGNQNRVGSHSGWFLVNSPPILVYSGDWDVHWRYGNLTHGIVGKTIPIREWSLLAGEVGSIGAGVGARKMQS